MKIVVVRVSGLFGFVLHIPFYKMGVTGCGSAKQPDPQAESFCLVPDKLKFFDPGYVFRNFVFQNFWIHIGFYYFRFLPLNIFGMNT